MFPSIGQFFARLFHKLFPPETQGCHYINGAGNAALAL